MESGDYRYIIGIDLGTTNSAVAYSDLESKEVNIFPITQLVNAEEVVEKQVLPSFLYIPGKYDIPQSIAKLPWASSIEEGIVGEFAKEKGAEIPQRLVSSAKSWLCHGKVDRKAKILPWGSKEDLKKVSPVEASSKYLEHIKEAWNYKIAKDREDLRLEEQFIIITVPASFDEIARELTVEAARMAGIKNMILIEEPLAAFYSWLYQHKDNWHNFIKPGQIVLICDIGGGTTDFTIVLLKELKDKEGVNFDRIAVGEHLLLGGDNMDIAIARHVEKELFGKVGALDVKRWHQLCYQCRKAKELLLGGMPSLESYKVTVLGRGTKLIGSTVTMDIGASTIREIILDGFFPFVPEDAKPFASSKVGLVEFGLPYVQDPAITRHLIWFWKRFEKLTARESKRERPFPDFVLFNGGALYPEAVRNRIVDVMESWFSHRPVELENPRPELAVAMGAAYYGISRLGHGIKVGAGSPRAYYVIIGKKESFDKPALEEALCIASRGMEEGVEAEITGKSLEVLSNTPVLFQLLSSISRVDDSVGDIVQVNEEEFLPLPPLRTVLRFGKKEETSYIPVTLNLKLTEVGTLEIWCKSLNTPHTWKLQFDIRQVSESERLEKIEKAKIEETLEIGQIEEALRIIRDTFEKRLFDPKDVVKTISSTFNLSKERWPLYAIRKMADLLIQLEKERGFSFHHESRWFNLLGFCLRPGYGDVLDEWRMKKAWKIYPKYLVYSRQPQCRIEWWIFWRRIAGGLTVGQQWHIFQNLSSHFQEEKSKKGKALSPEEMVEMWMAVASMERLPVEAKIKAGRTILEHLLKSKKPGYKALWAIAKLGARIPLYGPIDRVVPPEEVSQWIEKLMEKVVHKDESFAYNIINMGRKTGDRSRDIEEGLMEKIIETASKILPEKKVLSFFESPVKSLNTEDREWSFGETLPPGLILTSTLNGEN